MKNIAKILCFVLSLVLVFSVIGVSAFAEGESDVITVSEAITVTEENSNYENKSFVRADGYTGSIFNVADNVILTLTNCTVDGGAVWSVNEEALNSALESISGGGKATSGVGNYITLGEGNVTSTASLIVLNGGAGLKLDGTTIKNFYTTDKTCRAIQTGSGANSVTMNNVEITGVVGYSSAAVIGPSYDDSLVISGDSTKIHGNIGADPGAIISICGEQETPENTVISISGGEFSNNISVNGSMLMIRRCAGSINGGKFSENYALYTGGNKNCVPVYIHDFSDFAMTGGEISGNYTYFSGGIVAMVNSEINLEGGTIGDPMDGSFTFGSVVANTSVTVGEGMIVNGGAYVLSDLDNAGTINGGATVFGALENEGAIAGEVLVNGELTNSGSIDGDLVLGPNATISNLGNVSGELASTNNYVALMNGVQYATLADAIAAIGSGDVVIDLIGDATFDYNARDAYGTSETTSVTINGNGHVLTLNQKNSDWASIGLANAGAKLVLNEMTIEKTGYGDTSGAWNTHAIIFTCALEMKDVIVNNSMAVEGGAVLNNVEINEANGYYGLWIDANGQSVTMNKSSITATNGGRGIKIGDQYVGNVASVTLDITDTKFTTAEKAAVLVTSTEGAKITATNVDISGVAADSTNIAWVDEDRATDFGKVTVTGGTVGQESMAKFPITVKDENNNIISHYENLDDLFASDLLDTSDDYTVLLTGDVTASKLVDISDSRVGWNFVTDIEGGVTMTFAYPSSWNYVCYMSIGKNVTLNVDRLCPYGGVFDVYGTVNANYLFGMNAAITVKEGGVVNVTTGDATVQAKNNTWLEVYGTLNAGTVNVWNNNSRASTLIVSGEGASLTASHIHAWDGGSATKPNTITVENGATLSAKNLQADRDSEITVDNATVISDSISLGYDDNIGVLVAKNGADIQLTNGGKINASANATISIESSCTLNASVVIMSGDEIKGYFNNLQEAITEADDGQTVKLLADYSSDETINIKDKKITINLAGYTINGHILAPNANLTITNGNIVSEDAGFSAIEINAGTLVLTNVNVKSARHAVRIDGAVEATINGGKYELITYAGRTQHAVNISGDAKVTILAGDFIGPKGTASDSGAAVTARDTAIVTIKGGNFSGGKLNTIAGTVNNIVGGYFDQDVTAHLANGYRLVEVYDSEGNFLSYGVATASATPEINEDGNWVIGGVDTGLIAEPKITINENGFWVINGQIARDEEGNAISAIGEDGVSPVIEVRVNANGKTHWFINGKDTGVKAQGVDGVSIDRVEKIEFDEPIDSNVDTYYIYFTDGSKTTFTVTNGRPGEQGPQGPQGIEGPKGDKGEQGDPGADGNDNNKTVVISVAIATACTILALSVVLYRGVGRRSWWCTK